MATPNDSNFALQKTETAYDWFLRDRRKRLQAEAPHDPSSAAWDFVRPFSKKGGGSGIEFIDAALRRRPPDRRMPVIDVRGDSGKTWTVVSMAARFVVATRPSRFPDLFHEISPPPQVILLDSTYDVTASKLTYAIHSSLSRVSASANDAHLQSDLECCLSRIHLATVHDVADWVPILESVRDQIAHLAADHPTLVLWDGLLSEPSDETRCMEIIRQLMRLTEECNVMLLTTSSKGRRKREWDRIVTHRIRLEKMASIQSSSHDYLATIHGNVQVHFSICSAGILS